MSTINTGLFLLAYADELEKLAAGSNTNITEQTLKRSEDSKGFLVSVLREAGLSSILYGLVGAALGGLTGVGIGATIGDPMGAGLAGGAVGGAVGSQLGALAGGAGAAMQNSGPQGTAPGQPQKKPAQTATKITNPSTKFKSSQPNSGGKK